MPTPTASNDNGWTTVETTGGLALRVRPEQPGDGPALVALFSHLSPSSRFLRFSKVMDAPDPQRVQLPQFVKPTYFQSTATHCSLNFQ
jgi:hypothetical protein